MSPLITGELAAVLAEVDDDPTTMAMSMYISDMCRHLTTDLGWDVPAELCTIYREVEPIEPDHPLADGAVMMKLRSEPIGFDWNGFEGWQMADMMRGLARGLRLNHRYAARMIEGKDVVGWLMVHEGWTLSGDAAKSYASADLETRGQIRDHGERVECRILLVTDRSGCTYQATQMRGEDRVQLYIDRDGSELSGNLCEAMRELADALPEQVTP